MGVHLCHYNDIYKSASFSIQGEGSNHILVSFFLYILCLLCWQLNGMVVKELACLLKVPSSIPDDQSGGPKIFQRPSINPHEQ